MSYAMLLWNVTDRVLPSTRHLTPCPCPSYSRLPCALRLPSYASCRSCKEGGCGEVAATLAAGDVEEIDCLAVALRQVAPIGYRMWVTLGIPVALKASGIACALSQKRPAASGVLASLVALSFSRPLGGGARLSASLSASSLKVSAYIFLEEGGGGR